MWKHLFLLIYFLNRISYGSCNPLKRTLTTITESEIRVHREALERRHHVDYLNNEVIYRNWPEVLPNPKQYCERFLQKVLPARADLTSVIPVIRKVILNYRQIKDKYKNILPSKRVTALECKLHISGENRNLMYFIRSPQSPKCSLFLNRIGKRSLNFYIIEEICENNNYPNVRKYMVELEEDKSKGSTTYQRRLMLILSGEEIKAKHAEFEQKHYEYCLNNPGMCTLWSEVQTNPEYHCKRFFKRILPPTRDLSMVSAKIHQVILNYMEIENDKTHDSVVVNAIECRIPQPVQGRRYAFFIRAPLFPSCIFYIFRKMLPTEHFYIVEEICDNSNQEMSIFQIFLEIGKFHAWEDDLRKRRESDQIVVEATSKRFSFEQRHYEAYKLDTESFKIWPEAQSAPNHLCAHFLQGIITNNDELILVTGKVHEVILHYIEVQDTMNNQQIEPPRLNAMQCRLPNLMKGYRFMYLLKSPSYPDCTYLLSKLYKMHDKYYISQELCESTNFFSLQKPVSSVEQNELNSRRCRRDAIEKREKYEGFHLQYYLEKQNDCEQWPDLKLANKMDVCQALLTQIYPRLTQRYNIEAESNPLQLKYCMKKDDMEKAITLKNLMSLICTVPLMKPPNRFCFIKTHKSNCVYWAKRINRISQYYSIAKEICINELLPENQISVELNMDDVILLNNYLSDNKFTEYLRKNDIIS